MMSYDDELYIDHTRESYFSNDKHQANIIFNLQTQF